ncbi:MAG: ATP-binding cassette domain-containing protein, partial [Pedobacter sp.]
MKVTKAFIDDLSAGDFKTLARALSLVENDSKGSEDLLFSINVRETPVVGITGPPGAGKSTLVNGLTSHLSKQGKKIAILAVDPTSPFNYGSLLG